MVMFKKIKKYFFRNNMDWKHNWQETQVMQNLSGLYENKTVISVINSTCV